MKITLNISTDGAAFEFDAEGAEVARILRGAADRIEGGKVVDGSPIMLFDVNGNDVGEAFASGLR